MPRPSGGYAAGYATPVLSSNAAVGVWTPRDVYANRAAGTWPVVGTATPAFSTVGYTRLWGLTTKSSGLVTGTAATDTGRYNVKWWDNTITNHLSGGTFSKAAAGGYRAFEIYPVRLATTDSSSNAVLATCYGNAYRRTEQSKFGGASAFFDGSGDYLRTSIAFNYSSNFTIEFWFRRTGSGANNPTLYEAGDIQSGRGGLHISLANNQINVSNGVAAGIVGGGLPALNTWVHIAVVRNSGTNTLYVNGTSVGTSAQNYGTTVTNNIISIGGAPNYASYIAGFIDDFRQTQAAVYTANFSPPAAALTVIANTALLYNFDTDFGFTPIGQFDGFDVSSNAITQLRGESLIIDRGPGSNQSVQTYVGYPHYATVWVLQWVPGPPEFASLKNNNLAAADLNQFYTDLGACDDGVLSVQGNPGISADTPSIATAKGYTVFGSVPPATSLLLNLNGSPGSTTFTDSSPNSITVTASGSAAISTTHSKFGGASAFFNGAGTTKASFTSSSLFQFDEDFTIEAWVRLIATVDYDPILSVQNGSTDQTGWLLLQINQSLYFLGSDGSSWVTVLNSGTSLTLNQWSHVAVTRDSQTVRLFINGSQVAAGTATTVYSQGTTGYLGHYIIGGTTPTTMNGYLDDVRITKGIALYTGTFTPPTAQLTAL